LLSLWYNYFSLFILIFLINYIQVDDDSICDFFKDCGEIIGLRWLTHKDTGEFRGCGYIQFATTEAADKAKLLDGQMLIKRPIRIDWTD